MGKLHDRSGRRLALHAVVRRGAARTESGVLSTLIEVTQKMVEGELLQLTLIGNPQATPEELLDIVERKTGWLFSGCMKLPGIVAGLDQESVNRLADIGRNLGMAFQLVDDLLDLTSTQETLGKPVANDLKEGKVTLPVSFVMRNGITGDAERVTTVLAGTSVPFRR